MQRRSLTIILMSNITKENQKKISYNGLPSVANIRNSWYSLLLRQHWNPLAFLLLCTTGRSHPHKNSSRRHRNSNRHRNMILLQARSGVLALVSVTSRCTHMHLSRWTPSHPAPPKKSVSVKHLQLTLLNLSPAIVIDGRHT